MPNSIAENPGTGGRRRRPSRVGPFELALIIVLFATALSLLALLIAPK